jgi:signal transduction histidine kinase/CheY-like chemotaxis protein
MGSLLVEPVETIVASPPVPVAPPAVAVDRLDLRTLIDHDHSLPAATTVEEANRTFQATRLPYLPVLGEDSAPLGICSRGQIGFLLGSQYGFALYAKQAVSRHLLPRYLKVAEETPIRQVLEEALDRAGEEFHHDVVLVDRAGCFLGMLGVRALVRVQSMLVRQQMDDLARQRRDLAANNHDLFRSLNELRQSQGRYRILFEHSPVGVALLSTSGEMETLNESLAGWLGAEAGGNLLNAVEPKDRAALQAALGRASATSSGGAIEAWLRAGPDHPRRLLQVTLRGIAETGQVCACCLDVTQERALNRAALQREKQVFLDSLVGGIAHELNNKIHPILGFSDLLRSGEGDPEQRHHYADVICKSSAECARIVRQLLQFCQPAREEKVSCDLRVLAEEAASFLHFRIRERKATLLADLGTAPLPVLADPAQVKQVFLNLILNALDAMEKSPVREVRLTLSIQGGRYAARVADTGEGIRPEILDRIFDPFFTTKPQDKGTGLGLSVCQGIAKAHQGELQVESVPGEGAAFTFLLPCREETILVAEAAPAIPVVPVRLVPAPLPSRRALVIDDEPFVGGFIQEVLKRRFGFTVERADNGAAGIAKLEESSFDLVLCDVLMPVMNGLEVMRWLRAHQPERLANFLFVTGHDGGEERAAEIAASGLPVLSKPFTAETLSEKVLRLPAVARA